MAKVVLNEGKCSQKKLRRELKTRDCFPFSRGRSPQFLRLQVKPRLGLTAADDQLLFWFFFYDF